MHVKTLCLAATLTLVGCDWVDDVFIFKSANDKVNSTFALHADIEVKRAKLYLAFEPNKAEQRSFVKDYSLLLAQRASTCAAGIEVSRLDTASAIKRKLTDIDCFKSHEANIQSWLGLKSLSHALSLTALRPFTTLKARLSIPVEESVVSLDAASSANVAVIQDALGNHSTVDLSAGSVIRKFTLAHSSDKKISVSPNGRVAAVNVDKRGVTFVDTENGAILWRLADSTGLLAWLPSVEAALLKDDTNNSVLLDFRTGKTQIYANNQVGLGWAITVPTAVGQLIVGNHSRAYQVEFLRTAEGAISYETTSNWTFELTDKLLTKPWLMKDGSLMAYVSDKALHWIDLTSGRKDSLAMQPLRAEGLSQFDQTNITYTDFRATSQSGVKKIINLEAMTVSNAKTLLAGEREPLSLGPRGGLATNDGKSLVIQMVTAVEQTRPLAELINAIQLSEQLDLLNGKTSLGGATTNAALVGNRKPPSQGLLNDIPPNAALVVIGAYKGAYQGPLRYGDSGFNHGVQRSHYQSSRKRKELTFGSSERPSGDVKVNLISGSTPLVLVLSSYEPVTWNIQNLGSRKVAAILLSNFHEANVTGNVGAKVVKIGTSHAYTRQSAEYGVLKADIAKYTSQPVSSFMGSFEAKEFTVSN
jgi:hypothetical protein